MNFQKKKLSNGITVMLEKRELPVVALSITNPFGAVFEDSKIKGMAHFIEHLVFTGTKTRSHEDISREIEKKGGILNAFTSHDMTSFWFKLPSEHLFSGLDILTDMLNNPIFNPEKFEKEKKVVIEEIKMYHDAPMRHIHDQIEENLYDKPFGEGVIGSEKTIKALSRDFVADYYSKNYNPGNFLVTVVGNADFEKLCEYIESNFKPKESTSVPQKITKHFSDSLEERSGIDQAHFMIATHAPLPFDPNHVVLEVLDGYLANGMSSRLFLEIREKRGLAYSVRSSIEAEKNYAFYGIYVGTTKEAIPKVKDLILKEIENLQKMTEKDLDESKQRLIGLKKVYSEESSNVMNELMFSEIQGKAESYYEHEEKIRAVTLEQVKILAKSLNKFSTSAIVPK
jgi:predicted Zn-dependent peptidase